MSNPSSPSIVAPGFLLAGKYRLTRQLGEGAMGTVWAAVNESTVREVALKLIARPEPEFRLRLQREARALGALKHKNIIDIYDIEQMDTGEPFLVMQLLHGETVAERLVRKRRLEPEEAARIARDVARAIGAAHAISIVHRDLKPANIFLHQEPGDEGDPLVKVLDFGVAKNLSVSDGLHTAVGGAVGSPLYMSPEQVRAQRDVDHRADIWTLGVVLFEMLSGVRPFDGDAGQVFGRILGGDIPKVDRYVRRVDAGLVEVVAQCMRREREQRYQSAAEVVDALDRCIEVTRPSSAEWSRPNQPSTLQPGPPSDPRMQPGHASHPMSQPVPASHLAAQRASSALPPAASELAGGGGAGGSGPYAAYPSGPYPAYGSGGYPAQGAGPHAAVNPQQAAQNPAYGSGGYPAQGSGGSGGYPAQGSGGSGGYPAQGSGGSGGYPAQGSGGSGGYPAQGSGGSGGYPAQGSGGSGGYPAQGAGPHAAVNPQQAAQMLGPQGAGPHAPRPQGMGPHGAGPQAMGMQPIGLDDPLDDAATIPLQPGMAQAVMQQIAQRNAQAGAQGPGAARGSGAGQAPGAGQGPGAAQGLGAGQAPGAWGQQERGSGSWPNPALEPALEQQGPYAPTVPSPGSGAWPAHASPQSAPPAPASARPPQVSSPEVALDSPDWARGGTVKMAPADAEAYRQQALRSLQKTTKLPYGPASQAQAQAHAQAQAPAQDLKATTVLGPGAPVGSPLPPLPNPPPPFANASPSPFANPPGPPFANASQQPYQPTGAASTTTPLVSNPGSSGASPLDTMTAALVDDRRRRNRLAAAIVGVLVGLAAAAGIVFALSSPEGRPELTPASTTSASAAPAPAPPPPPAPTQAQQDPSPTPKPTATASAVAPPESTAPTTTAPALPATPSPVPQPPAPTPPQPPAPTATPPKPTTKAPADPCAGKTGFLLAECKKRYGKR